MDISALSINMSQASLATEVSTSVVKMAMDSSVEEAKQMNDMISDIAVDSSRGNIIDAKA